jgi:hypothetical protein
MLFVISVVSCLNVLYMYIVYVGVRYCNHDTITCGYLRVLFGLWCSSFISIPLRFPYGVVVLFGTSCFNVPALFIPVFLIGIVGGGGIQLGPLGTTAINRPTVPAPGDNDDGEIGGMMVGRGNRSTRRKPAPVPLCPP